MAIIAANASQADAGEIQGVRIAIAKEITQAETLRYHCSASYIMFNWYRRFIGCQYYIIPPGFNQYWLRPAKPVVVMRKRPVFCPCRRLFAVLPHACPFFPAASPLQAGVTRVYDPNDPAALRDAATAAGPLSTCCPAYACPGARYEGWAASGLSPQA